MYKKLLLSIVILIIILSLYIFYDTLTVEPYYDVAQEIKDELAKNKKETKTNKSDQDRLIRCVANAEPEDVADAYIDCCKSDTSNNAAICKHPIFEKCKNNYKNKVNDPAYIKYLGPQLTYDSEKKKFKNCARSLFHSFDNYDNTYVQGTSKQYVTKLYPLKNKNNIETLCKNMCNAYQDDCVGYQTDGSDCMLYKSIMSVTDLTPNTNSTNLKNMESVDGTKLFIKS